MLTQHWGPARHRELHELVPRASQHAQAAVVRVLAQPLPIAVEVELPVCGIPPALRRIAARDERRERATVCRGGNLKPKGLTDRRKDIDGLGVFGDGGAARAVCGGSRVADDAGQVVGAVEEAGLRKQPVFADLFPVVLVLPIKVVSTTEQNMS